MENEIPIETNPQTTTPTPSNSIPKKKTGPQTRKRSKPSNENAEKDPKISNKKRKQLATQEMREATIDLSSSENSKAVGHRIFFESAILKKNNKDNNVICEIFPGSLVKIFDVEKAQILVAISTPANGKNPTFWIVDENKELSNIDSVGIANVTSFEVGTKDLELYFKFIAKEEEIWEAKKIQLRQHLPEKVHVPQVDSIDKGISVNYLQSFEIRLKEKESQIEQKKLEIANLHSNLKELQEKYVQEVAKANQFQGEVKIYEKFTSYIQKKDHDGRLD